MNLSLSAFLAFVLFGIVSAVVIYFLIRLQMRDRRGHVTVRRYVLTAIAAALIAAVVSWSMGVLLDSFGPGVLGPPPNLRQMDAYWVTIAAYVAMIVGMSASYFNRLINERRSKIDKLKIEGSSERPGLEFDLWDFVQPFFVSLITFGAIYSRLRDGDMFATVLLGFETGFFWQTILAGRERK